MAVAGLLAALRATNTKMSDHTFLFQGAGEAAIGIANLIAMEMEKNEGTVQRTSVQTKLVLCTKWPIYTRGKYMSFMRAPRVGERFLDF